MRWRWLIGSLVLAMLTTGTGLARVVHELTAHAGRTAACDGEPEPGSRESQPSAGHSHCQIHLRLDQPWHAALSVDLIDAPAVLDIAPLHWPILAVQAPFPTRPTCRSPPQFASELAV